MNRVERALTLMGMGMLVIGIAIFAGVVTRPPPSPTPTPHVVQWDSPTMPLSCFWLDGGTELRAFGCWTFRTPAP